jgi:hypothetical protein
MATTNNMTFTLQQLDSAAKTLASRTVTLTDATATVGDFRGVGTLIDTTLTTIGLPIAQVRQLELRNTHTTAKVTVTWTPTTGASAVAIILGPGDAICFWHLAAGSTYGISQLKLQSDTANTSFELFLGG